MIRDWTIGFSLS